MATWDVHVRTDGGVRELEEIADWLRREPELQGRVGLEKRAIGDGELGTLPEALEIAIGGSGILPVLLQSIQTWLSLRNRSRVRLTIRESSGRVVEVEADRPQDIERFLHATDDQ
ncbi:hypothetical protein [Streptomyces sp. NPDC058457]|uniref:effector-associated constant component EACC1 n=1 Tax=Streptomyces sp. NPDC058457 TaxID=3346507 RepID=UPI0036642EF8